MNLTNATNTTDAPMFLVYLLGSQQAQANLLAYAVIALLAFVIYGLVGVGLISSHATKKKLSYLALLLFSYISLVVVWFFTQWPEYLLWVTCGLIGIVVYILSSIKRHYHLKDKFLYIAVSLTFIGMMWIKQIAELIVNWIMPS